MQRARRHHSVLPQKNAIHVPGVLLSETWSALRFCGTTPFRVSLQLQVLLLCKLKVLLEPLLVFSCLFVALHEHFVIVL
jgi:hypothetical protein